MNANPALPSVATWLIDGYNVLHAGLLRREERAEWWHQGHRDRLIGRVRSFESAGVALWIAFDGEDEREIEPEGRATCACLHVVYARSADEWILKRVREAREPERIAVVTGDRKVAARVRHRGAGIVAPRLFLACCHTPER